MLKPLHSCRILKNIYSEIITFLHNSLCEKQNAAKREEKGPLVTMLMKKKTSHNFFRCVHRAPYLFLFSPEKTLHKKFLFQTNFLQ